MQKMYEDYKDVAEFRLLYIKEAHASDSNWPVEYAKKMGITQHKSYGERCAVARRLLSDEKLTIPTLVDDMEDSVNKAYAAWPDRVYLVRTDGCLGVAGKQGPWGFKPALDAAKEWLAVFKETGQEPPVPERTSSAEEANEEPFDCKPGPEIDEKSAAVVVGSWNMSISFGGQVVEGELVFAWKDGRLDGNWTAGGQTSRLCEIEVCGNTLKFSRQMGRGSRLSFEGRIEEDRLIGEYDGPFGTLTSRGRRSSPREAP